MATLGLAPSAQGETTPFSNGTAKATAVVARVAPGVGNLQLGISAGVAVAEVKNTIGQAQAKALDLGLIGSTLTGRALHRRRRGGQPVGPAAADPGGQPRRQRQPRRGLPARSPAPPSAAAARRSSATTDPSAMAVSKIVETINGLLDIQGGRAEATTRVINGRGPGGPRQGVAST